MIIQTAPAGEPHLAVMMHEHLALCSQFARAFGNEAFEPLAPLDEMIYVIAHHDAGWEEFDRDPVTDESTGLPYNLIDTPIKHITVTSRLSPDYNERHHPYSGLISSMHSWGLYNGRYGISDLVLIDKVPQQDRPIADRMLSGELERQRRLKAAIAKDARMSAWLADDTLLQNYKQLQFLDTLALYFNRVHPGERKPQAFTHVPRSAKDDVTVTIRPSEPGVYALSPYPFADDGGEFAFAGRPVRPREHAAKGGWPTVLRQSPTQWESFRLVAG